MKRIVVLAAVACGLLGHAEEAQAQTTPSWCTAAAPCVFTTVDSVMATANRLYVTGILEGKATPTERYVSFSTSTSSWDSLAACQRLAMLAMARPGEYVLRMALPVDAYTFTTCGLSRVTP